MPEKYLHGEVFAVNDETAICWLDVEDQDEQVKTEIPLSMLANIQELRVGMEFIFEHRDGDAIEAFEMQDYLQRHRDPQHEAVLDEIGTRLLARRRGGVANEPEGTL